MRKKPDGLILRDGVWYVQKNVKYGGASRFVRCSTGFRQEERREAEAARDRIIAGTLDELRNPPRAREHTFREAAVEYVLSLERRGKDPVRAEIAIRDVDGHIGAMGVSRVHQGLLAQYEQRCKKSGMASATVARTYTVVVAVLNHAARVLRDDDRPWLHTAVPKISAPDWGDARKPYRLTWEEQDKLLEALDQPRRVHLVAPVMFAISTGARQAEVTGLRWDWEQRIDGIPEYSVWLIPAEVRKQSARLTKSQQTGRYLVANAMARSIISTQPRDGVAVFNGVHGQMDQINGKAYHDAWRSAGLPIDGYVHGVHNLRHTFAERLAETGTPIDMVKRVLGHDGGGVTSRYIGPVIRQMLAAVELVTRENVTVPRVVTQIATQKVSKVAGERG
jgi:integrase